MPVLSRGAEEARARRAQSKGRLLEATEVLLAEGGPYADLRIEQIASRAGMSRSAFYESFADKRELLMDLAERVAAPLLAGSEDLGRIASGDGEDMRRLISAALSLARAHAAVFRALFEASTYDEAIGQFWLALGARFAGPLAQWIENRQRAREGSPLDARAGASVLVGMVVQALYQQVSHETGFGDEQLIDALSTVCERALDPTAAHA
jgi:TetR/AcrR family transcriptional regulator, ethionamide resistance regulator